MTCSPSSTLKDKICKPIVLRERKCRLTRYMACQYFWGSLFSRSIGSFCEHKSVSILRPSVPTLHPDPVSPLKVPGNSMSIFEGRYNSGHYCKRDSEPRWHSYGGAVLYHINISAVSERWLQNNICSPPWQKTTICLVHTYWDVKFDGMVCRSAKWMCLIQM